MKVKIIDYDHLARGIAKVDGKVVFVPKVKKNEVVDIQIVDSKKKYDIGKLINEKVQPPIFCPHYFICGGCQLQHLTYQEQLEFKCNKVKNILEKYTPYKNLGELFIESSIEKHYRNKVTLHIKNKKVGFYQDKTHQMFSLETCFLVKPKIQMIIDKVKKFVQEYDGLEEVMIRQLGEDIAISFEGTIEKEILINYFSNDVVSITYCGNLVFGKPYLTSTILNKKFLVSQESFFQVNDEGLEKIYQKVIDELKKSSSKNVLDLYCGTGTISLLASDYAKKVVGIEINEQAIKDAKENQKLNHINNVTFYAGDVSSILSNVKEYFDVVIVDPPRSGLSQKTKHQLTYLKPLKIIYVSCDPLTLARDLNDLSDFYQLDTISLVDEFPQTYHVECVCVLNRR